MTFIISVRLIVLLSLQVARPDSASATQPSFDCGKARSWSERELCRDDTLASLDVTLASLYQSQVTRFEGTQKKALIKAQGEWIANRDACKYSDSPAKCLIEIYNKRISELSDTPSFEIGSTNQPTALPPERSSTSVAKVVPDAREFEGVWTGTGKQSNGSVWTIRIEINEAAAQYLVAYPSLNCGGRLLPQSRETNRFNFREQITYGHGACVDQGIMELTHASKDKLNFSWAYPNGKRDASGQLSRSHEEAIPTASDVKTPQPGPSIASQTEARLGIGELQEGKAAQTHLGARFQEETATPKKSKSSAQATAAHTDAEDAEYEVYACNQGAKCQGVQGKQLELCETPKNSVFVYLQDTQVLLNDDVANAYILRAYRIATDFCTRKGAPANICIMSIRDRRAVERKCFAGGYVDSSGDVKVYYNNLVKAAAEARVEAQKQEEMKENARRAMQAKRDALLAFFKKADVIKVIDLSQLSANPFLYDRNNVASIAYFEQMISKDEALFSKDGIGAIVSEIPADRFTERRTVLLAGRVKGNRAWKTPFGGEVLVPFLKYIDVFEGGYDAEDLEWAKAQAGIK